MNPESLQPRERRVIALGILAALILAFSVGVVKPVHDRYRHYHEAIEDLGFRIERLSRVVSSRPVLTERLALLGEEVRAAGLTVDRATPALAAADMQRQLGDLVAASGGQVQSTQVVPPVAQEGFLRVAVRIQMSGDSRSLAEVFEAIEGARPLMFIDNVRVQDRQRSAPRGQGGAPAGEQIDVHFDAVVFMQGSSGSGS